MVTVPLESTQISSVMTALAVYALAVPLHGPSLIVITRASVTDGRKADAAAALGTTLGAVFYAVATQLGLTTLLTAFPWMLLLIQMGGGAVLIFIGLSLLWIRSSKSSRKETDKDEFSGENHSLPRSVGKAFSQAFFVSMGNPKIVLFFVGLFAPIAGNATRFEASLALLLGVALIDLVYHQTLALGTTLASRVTGVKGRGKWLDTVAGILMTLFGRRLLMGAVLG